MRTMVIEVGTIWKLVHLMKKMCSCFCSSYWNGWLHSIVVGISGLIWTSSEAQGPCDIYMNTVKAWGTVLRISNLGS